MVKPVILVENKWSRLILLNLMFVVQIFLHNLFVLLQKEDQLLSIEQITFQTVLLTQLFIGKHLLRILKTQSIVTEGRTCLICPHNNSIGQKTRIKHVHLVPLESLFKIMIQQADISQLHLTLMLHVELILLQITLVHIEMNQELYL